MANDDFGRGAFPGGALGGGALSGSVFEGPPKATDIHAPRSVRQSGAGSLGWEIDERRFTPGGGRVSCVSSICMTRGVGKVGKMIFDYFTGFQ